LAASWVGQGRVAHNIAAQGVHGGNHEPLHDGAERILHEAKFARRVGCPVLCMRTNQPNQRPPHNNQYARQVLRGVAPSPSPAWWESHFACSRGPRVHAITTAVFRHESQRCDDNAPPFDRSAKRNAEPIGLAVSPASATIMKVAARHEAESKIDNPLSGSCWGGHRPRPGPVPEMFSAALRWAK
jgi:hypothetical protein